MFRSPRTKKERLEYRAYELDRMRKDGWITAKSTVADAVVCWKDQTVGHQRFYLKIYRGSACNTDIFHSFRTSKARQEFAEATLKRMGERQSSNKTRVNVDASDHWQVGDVMSYSWGYDQTNVDFFEVVRVSKKCVWVREIWQNSSDSLGGPTGGRTQPRRGDYKSDKIIRKVVGKDGYISFDHGCGSKWTGSSLYTSSYH